MAALARSSVPRLLALAHPLARSSVPLRHLATFPDDRKYVKSHEWAKLDGGVATVGISHHAQGLLGDIVFADLPDVGDEASAGSAIAVVESVKAAADVYSPVSGEVVDVNINLGQDPTLINNSPHSDGWMFKVKVSDPSQLDALMSSSEYEGTIEKTD